jgi:hypothetical protein
MDCYSNFDPFFGDIHNHCNITFGHGSIEDAIRNAKERLHFCSVTGHAYWPDIPEPNNEIKHIVDFHKAGFEKLKKTWKHALQVIKENNQEGRFVTFPSFEVHSCEDGDRTIVYKQDDGGLFYPDSTTEMEETVRQLRGLGTEVLYFPHHIGYKLGRRGVNWNTFNTEFSPVVEIVSLHGSSEREESSRPLLTQMGPKEGPTLMQTGLQQGHFFGVIGNTDHHSGHPGSYGNGMTCVWAEELTRESIWDALWQKRTYALTGDKNILQFAVNNHPMGSELPFCKERHIEIDSNAGGFIDYIDIIKNNRLLKRFSSTDVPYPAQQNTMRTKLFLEVGWGHRDYKMEWSVELGVSKGKIIDVDPRFRGHLVISPLDESNDADNTYFSHWEQVNKSTVSFRTTTWGNPNPYSNTCQGLCIEVDSPPGDTVTLNINGRSHSVSLQTVLEQSVSGFVSENIESPAWRLHKAPISHDYHWNVSYLDSFGPENSLGTGDVYYVPVRQENDQWAWSSPIRVKPTP